MPKPSSPAPSDIVPRPELNYKAAEKRKEAIKKKVLRNLVRLQLHEVQAQQRQQEKVNTQVIFTSRYQEIAALESKQASEKAKMTRYYEDKIKAQKKKQSEVLKNKFLST